MCGKYTTQNELVLKNLLKYYNHNNFENLEKILPIVDGRSTLSIRIIDWFVTNYAKKYYTVYNIKNKQGQNNRFKVYNNYKLQLKAYSKKRFDPFCRWDRITIPYNNGNLILTTIGQLNFFKWALDYKIIDYIRENIDDIEKDMNSRNSTAKRKTQKDSNNKTRKKREELSISAIKSIKREDVEIIVKFD